MAKRGRGRPPFKPTRAMRLSVARMRACGDSIDTIRRAIGVDDDTLRKHFGEELATGAAQVRRKVVDAVFRGVDGGNAALIRRAEEMTRAATALDEIDASEKAARPTKLGKKEVQHQDALTAGLDNEWADDLKPNAAVN